MCRSGLLVVAALFTLTGCRVLGPGGSSDVPASIPSSAVGVEAPEACGFPPGTPLEFAGRATTAGLNVQEVVGDPMSDDPADIYITREAFDQGEHHGRLVCAVFVNDPGFVEVTVHPEDGGRFEPVEPTPRPTPPPGGIAESDAVRFAEGEAPVREGWELLGVMPGSVSEFRIGRESEPWTRDVPPDQWVWLVQFARDDVARDVFVDYLDGSVLGMSEYRYN
jgi:hypothetical protein